MNESTRQLVNDEELKLLFPNEIQREIFVKLMADLLEFIFERTSLHGVKLTFD